MIDQLRKKMILTNMVFALGTLLLIFSAFFYYYVRHSLRDRHALMESRLDRFIAECEASLPGERLAARFPESVREYDPLGHLYSLPGSSRWTEARSSDPPFKFYKLKADGSILITTEGDLGLSEEAERQLIEALLRADRGALQEELLRHYDLSYRLKLSESGLYYLALGDISRFRDRMHGFFLLCCLSFVLASIPFFLLSYLLSQRALAPVKNAWENQRRFVADASHELKTPLTVILANLDIISSHPDGAVREQSRWIENTREEAEGMSRLVQELLFLARSDINSPRTPFSPVDLSNCAEGRILTFESVAFERNVSLRSEIAENLQVLGNESLLKQLFFILLDNAVKYAGPGGKARLQVQRRQNSAVITVENTGKAISAEDQMHIFERFYRTDRSRSRTEGGYGLGLPIAANIVRMHRGRISCESDESRGTVFTVELPLC